MNAAYPAADFQSNRQRKEALMAADGIAFAVLVQSAGTYTKSWEVLKCLNALLVV